MLGTALERAGLEGSMTAAILGLMTFFTFPLDLVATVLITSGEGAFEEE